MSEPSNPSLDELRAGGEKVDEGRFRIDSKRALERLRNNRLARPEEWVLDVLRAAQASGATKVKMRTDADDVEVAFDGKPFPAAVMKDLLSHALGSDEANADPRVRLFALGVAGALGVGLQSLKVASGGVTLEIDGDGSVTLGESTSDGTTLAAHKRFRLGLAKALFTGSPEAKAVTGADGHYGPKLVLNGKVEGRLRPTGTPLTEGDVTVTSEVHPRTSYVKLLVYGINAGVRFIDLPGVQLHATLSCDKMRRDASGLDIVDNDPYLKQGLAVLERKSLEFLAEELEKPTDTLRAQLAQRLRNEPEMNAKARELIEAAPLVPDPAGGFVSIAALKADVEQGRAVRFATQKYPKDTFPANTVLLDHTTRALWERLLPGKRREDVDAIVSRNLVSARNRERWAAQPPEPVELPNRTWLAMAKVETPKLVGAVGIEAGSHGAFVRLLGQGKFLQAGEVTSLAPLRLRAVVDFRGNLPKRTWEEVPSDKLWKMVVSEVEDGALRATLSLLGKGELDDDARDHAKDLLSRLGRTGVAFAGLPQALIDAPLFGCLGGTRASLADLQRETPWRFVTTPFASPLLSGKRVLVLDEADHALLAPYAEGRWKGVLEEVEREAMIRQRLEGPKQKPVVNEKVVSVPIRAEGLTGEVALTDDDSQLTVDVFRDGFWLERTRLAARYGVARAAVDSPKLTPNEDWTGAVRDTAFNEALAAVREGERALAAEVVRAGRYSKMRGSLRRYLLAFAQKELKGHDFATDPLIQLVVQAPFIDTPGENISFEALRTQASAHGHVWLVPPNVDGIALKGQPVIVGGADVEALVTTAIGWEPEDGVPELTKADARRRFEEQKEGRDEIAVDAPLRCEVAAFNLHCTACLEDGLGASTRVIVRLRRKRWHSDELPSGVPMRVVVDLDDDVDPATELTDELRASLAGVVAQLQSRMLAAALDDPGAAPSRRAIMFALKGRLETATSDEVGQRLLNATVFECTDGIGRSASSFDRAKKVAFCTKRLEGNLRSGQLVILALDADTAVGLARFRDRQNVTAAFEQELQAREDRKRVAPVSAVRFTPDKLVSRRIQGAVTEGELAIAPDVGGQLELFLDYRALCTVPDALPWPFAATVNCDSLTPDAAHSGVEHDKAYDALLQQLKNLAAGLAVEFAEAWPALAANPSARKAALRICAWLYAGKKRDATTNNPLLGLPLCTSSEEKPLTVAQLLGENTTKGSVLVATRTGTLLDDAPRWVWQASAEERSWLAPLKLTLSDAEEQLDAAAKVRARPKAARMEAQVQSPWREPVEAAGVQGEVALPQRPTGRLLVDLFRQNVKLDFYDAAHPLGGVACINCDALTPNATWSKAVRTPVFREVMGHLEAALERLVARRLMAEPHDAEWRSWCQAAARSAARGTGPLAKTLPTLPLFVRLDGTSVTIGDALSEFARTRRVAVAVPGLEAGDRLVLQSSPETLEVLAAFGLAAKDVSDELRRKGEQDADRRARRLGQLSWPGDALVRLPLHGDGLQGELAVPLKRHGELTLAKQGVRIQEFHRDFAPGVVGVVDIETLIVDTAWTQGTTTPSQREAINQRVDELNEKLARTVPELDRAERAAARDYVLRWLEHAGVKAPLHLERLTGAVLSLAAARVFETVDGDWVSAVGIAEEVRRRGKVAVFEKSLFKPDTTGVLALVTRGLRDEWLLAVEGVLGRGSVERVNDRSLWRERMREEDPPKGTPERWALDRLRRDVRLLRAGALGELSPEDLEDVRLKALGGRGGPVHYDKKRKLALLDSDHPQVNKALADAATRRERIYVLLAAMYGAINRALERITDQHEAHLLGALAAHLAANPKLLAGDGQRGE